MTAQSLMRKLGPGTTENRNSRERFRSLTLTEGVGFRVSPTCTESRGNLERAQLNDCEVFGVSLGESCLLGGDMAPNGPDSHTYIYIYIDVNVYVNIYFFIHLFVYDRALGSLGWHWVPNPQLQALNPN